MPQRDELYLADMVGAARQIADWLAGVTPERWTDDSMLRNAVLRQLMVIGEAARAVSEETRLEAPELPWPQIVGFRHIAVHQYFAIDWSVVWNTARLDAPSVEGHILTLLRHRFPDTAKRFDGPEAEN